MRERPDQDGVSANPNNPTGTYLPFNEVKRLHAGLPKTTCWSSMRPMRNMSGATIMSRASSSSTSDNVVMTRTFEDLWARGAYAWAGPIARLMWPMC